MSNLHLKQGLNSQQLTLLNGEYEDKKKTPLLAYLLWFFFGTLGGHRYYLGDIGMGIAMTLTLGGLGFWALIDVFFIGKRIQSKNSKLEADLISKIHTTASIAKTA